MQTELEAWTRWQRRGGMEADCLLNDNSRARAELYLADHPGETWRYHVNPPLGAPHAQPWDGSMIRNFEADAVGPHDGEAIAILAEWAAAPLPTVDRAPIIERLQDRLRAIGCEWLNWS